MRDRSSAAAPRARSSCSRTVTSSASARCWRLLTARPRAKMTAKMSRLPSVSPRPRLSSSHRAATMMPSTRRAAPATAARPPRYAPAAYVIRMPDTRPPSTGASPARITCAAKPAAIAAVAARVALRRQASGAVISANEATCTANGPWTSSTSSSSACVTSVRTTATMTSNRGGVAMGGR